MWLRGVPGKCWTRGHPLPAPGHRWYQSRDVLMWTLAMSMVGLEQQDPQRESSTQMQSEGHI